MGDNVARPSKWPTQFSEPARFANVIGVEEGAPLMAILLIRFFDSLLVIIAREPGNLSYRLAALRA